MAKIFLDLRIVFKAPTIAKAFDVMVTNILSLFVVIELLKSIIEFFEIHRLRITFIIDGVLVFVLREVMIKVYQNQIDAIEIGAISLLLLIIGVTRTLAIVYSPDRP